MLKQSNYSSESQINLKYQNSFLLYTHTHTPPPLSFNFAVKFVGSHCHLTEFTHLVQFNHFSALSLQTF